MLCQRQITILTCTFKLLTFPTCGISSKWSARFSKELGAPILSFPKSSIYFVGNLNFYIVIELEHCSNPIKGYFLLYKNMNYDRFSGLISITWTWEFLGINSKHSACINGCFDGTTRRKFFCARLWIVLRIWPKLWTFYKREAIITISGSRNRSWSPCLLLINSSLIKRLELNWQLMQFLIVNISL